MPDLERESDNAAAKESHDLFRDAYNLGKKVYADSEGRDRQFDLLEYGALLGGIKDIPNEFIHHPWETIGKLSTAGVSGVALSAALAAESPIIVSAATATSVVITAAGLWHTYVELASNKKLQQSLDAMYKSDDKHTLNTSQQVASEVIGPVAFNYGIAAVGGFAGMHGPGAYESLTTAVPEEITTEYNPPNVLGPEALKYGTEVADSIAKTYGPEAFENMSTTALKDILQHYIPMPRTYSDDPVHMIFKGGTVIHIHGDQAIEQTNGWEHDLKVTENGIHMQTLRSLAGREVIRAWRQGLEGQGTYNSEPIEIDSDPNTRIRKITSGESSAYFHHEKAGTDPTKMVWSSCRQCRIEDDLINRSPKKRLK